MRTSVAIRDPGVERQLTQILGAEQVDWLVPEVAASRATSKAVSADMPLGLVVPDEPVNQESVANRKPGAPLGKKLEVAAILSAFNDVASRTAVDHRGRALLRGAPLRPRASCLHQLQPVLGDRRGRALPHRAL
jgi:4-aminobutyrate aminotransferase-like enzyme